MGNVAYNIPKPEIPEEFYSDIFYPTFTISDDSIKTLPTIEQILEYIVDDRKSSSNDKYEKYYTTHLIRQVYCKKSFPILIHEFISNIKELCKTLNIDAISEISCGIGWFSYWLKKYGINIIHSVDNKSWDSYNQNDYLGFVKQMDSIEYIKRSRDFIKMYIMSWPYMDDVAYDCWNAMKKGQYLLYIGEDNYGCTANEKFFEAVYDYRISTDETSLLNREYLSYDGIHDKPILYRKG